MPQLPNASSRILQFRHFDLRSSTNGLHYTIMLFGLFSYSIFLVVGLANGKYTAEHFDAWMVNHGKAYKDQSEYDQRFQNFLMNAKVVDTHNEAYDKGYTSYAMSLNSPFADMTDAEFEASHLMAWQNCSATTHPSSGLVASDDIE